MGTNQNLVLTLTLGIVVGFSISYCFVCWALRDLREPMIDENLFANHLMTDYENRTVADEIATRVRVLCFIILPPNEVDYSQSHIKTTWGSRCNVLLLIGDRTDSSVPLVEIPPGSNRWNRLKFTLKYVYENYYHVADWFFSADVTTYGVLENIRHMLYTEDPNEATMFGYLINGYASIPFGQSSWILSKRALKLFVERGIYGNQCNTEDSIIAEYEMNKCLAKLQVYQKETLDSLKKTRFFPVKFDQNNQLKLKHPDSKFLSCVKELSCVSDVPVVFYGVSQPDMYVLDYLIYHLRPYGIGYQQELKK